MLVLGIETTCDETAAAVVQRLDDGRGVILSNVVLSQAAEHQPYGGVVPEIAARAHVEGLDHIIAKAMTDAGVPLNALDAIAALPSVAECESSSALAELPARPSEKTPLEALETVERELARLVELSARGTVEEAAARAVELVPRAAATEYRPALADVALFAATHVRSSDTWRDDFAAGALPVDSPFGDGTFTLSVQDGQDLNGDGVISVPDEGDGDLTDDVSDPVTLTVIGRVGNVTHTVSAVVQPASSEIRVKMLYLLQSGSPAGLEQERIAMFEGWGYTVVTLASTVASGSAARALPGTSMLKPPPDTGPL